MGSPVAAPASMFNDLPLIANSSILIAAAVVVWFAGARVAGYADRIAAQTGLGEGLLGFMLLGVATSTPEIAVSVTAAVSGTPELSVNDVLGSASINLVILALADTVYGRGALTSTPGTPHVMLQGVLSILLLALVIGPTITGDRLLLGIGAWSWLIGAAERSGSSCNPNICDRGCRPIGNRTPVIGIQVHPMIVTRYGSLLSALRQPLRSF